MMGDCGARAHLCKEGELCALALGERLDLGVGARLLGAELVAGEPQHSQLIRADTISQLNCARREQG
jgi:hypothetical protein